MTKRTRLIIGGLFYALMFFFVAVNIYLHAAGVGSYDGWTAMGDDKGRLVITSFDPNGPASILQIGDVFVAINGLTRNEDPDIVNYSGRITAGTPYRMTVMRGNAVLELLLHTAPYPPDKRRNDYKLIMAAVVRLMFLLPGFFLLLVKPDDRQAWLLALLFGAFGSLLGDTLNPLYFGRGVEWLCSLARILSFLGFPFFVLFFLDFPQPSPWLQRNRWFNWLIYLPLLLFVMPTFGASRLPGYVQRVFFGHPLVAPFYRSGWLLWAAKWTVVGYLAAGLICLALNYRIAQPDARRRARVAILGSSIGFLFMLALIVLEFNGGQAAFPRIWRVFDLITPFVTPLIPLSFIYAIIRHKVIPISLIIRRGVRYLLVSRGAIVIESLAAILIAVLYVKVLYPDWRLVTVIMSAAMSIAAWKVIDRLHRRFVAPAIDRRFFRQSYDAQRLIGELSDSLQTTTEVPRLLELVATKLQAALQTESVTILLKDRQSGKFKSAYACEYDPQSGSAVNCQRPSELPANSHSLEALALSDEPLELDWPAQPDAKPVWLNNGNSSDSFLKQELQVLQT
ncbi:MAG: hypothetical protein HOP19_08060, partial [Acidobacteria bacterium]|nr:hypothetical protein [Acidobacteriota bacterium]